jgi:hypothetical protein
MFSFKPLLPDYSQVSQFDLARMIRLAGLLYKDNQEKNGRQMELREIYKLDLIMQTPSLPHTHYDLRFFKNKILHDHMTDFLSSHKVMMFFSEDPATLEKYFFIFRGKLENAKLDSQDEVDFLSRLGMQLQVDLNKFAKLPENLSEKPRVAFK